MGQISRFPLPVSVINASICSSSCFLLKAISLLYSRTPLTRTLKGNENLFELAGFRVIGVD